MENGFLAHEGDWINGFSDFLDFASFSALIWTSLTSCSASPIKPLGPAVGSWSPASKADCIWRVSASL